MDITISHDQAIASQFRDIGKGITNHHASSQSHVGGFELLAEVTPDLILMDAVMPGLSGFETTRRIKRDPALAFVPVIFMTGLTESEHIVKGFRAGGADYVTKPVKPDEVCVRVEAHLKRAQAQRRADMVVNAGGPPPGMWYDWEREDFLKALDSNMLTPIAMMKALLPGMMERGWGRVVNITSRSVKAPLLPLGLSNAARAGLTGFVAGTSRQIADKGVTINNLLPGVHDTARIDQMDDVMAAQKGISRDEARKIRAAGIPAGRYGDPAEFGKMCAFLCSAHAGYIVGQNIVLDGGETFATI